MPKVTQSVSGKRQKDWGPWCSLQDARQEEWCWQRLGGVRCWGVPVPQATPPGATPLTLQPRLPSLYTSELGSALPAQRCGCSPEAVWGMIFFLGGGDDFEFLKNYIYLSFILAAQVFISAHRIFNLRCGLWDLVPGPRVKPGLPALGALSLSHWTTREAPGGVLNTFRSKCYLPSCQ